MPNTFTEQYTRLKRILKKRNIRGLVCLSGTLKWAESMLPNVKDTVLVSSEPLAYTCFMDGVSWAKVKSYLGRELNDVVVDASQGFDAEKFSALVGCLRGGCTLTVVIPDRLPQTPFEARLFRMLVSYSNVVAKESSGESSLELPKTDDTEQGDIKTPFVGGMTKDQSQAFDDICKVVTGHRRRPLLITADRGRGKSAVLGLAAASLMQTRAMKVIVTSPSPANVDTLFAHALSSLGEEAVTKKLVVEHGSSSLSFVAPDALLEGIPYTPDLVIVDEAAAIPVPMLEQMLQKFSRICFSSTIHGYEGTGRGFATRFIRSLDEKAPQWRRCQLSQPVRWEEGDPLEQWLFNLMLLNAEPDEVSEAPLTYKRFEPGQIAENEQLLTGLFGLMVNAHYQTSPNDLVQLLNDSNTQVFCALQEGKVAGAAVVLSEGGQEEGLAEAVCAGKRRIRGHLLAQSLACHTGCRSPLVERAARIQRIAVHPSLQNSGIGTQLVREIELSSKQQGFDYLGTSFGGTKKLYRFWEQCGFKLARIGIQRDAASGTHSLQMLKMLNRCKWFVEIREAAVVNFPTQVTTALSRMEPSMVAELYRDLGEVRNVPEICSKQVDAFSKGALSYELVSGSLVAWFTARLQSGESNYKENCPSANLAISKILLLHNWQTICYHYGFSGRKQAEAALRSWVAEELA
ncbi:GNAT family N-acetyltransferase [Parasalinivibrio latis]|uniref:tRNA(Met) cytidine acetyltransferase TmcA n=1 Tax=Parasalinivibrio latis TaxID=2952610 RepID=UPI0030E46D47